MEKKARKNQAKSLKATHEQNKRMQKAMIFIFKKGFKSLRAVCKHLNIEYSWGRKAFLGILNHKKAIECRKKIERFIGFNELKTE